MISTKTIHYVKHFGWNKSSFLTASRFMSLDTQIHPKDVNGSCKNAMDQEWQKAVSYEKIPGPTVFTIVKNFFPWGKYYKLPRLKLSKMMIEEYGPVLRVPGSFGRDDIIIIYDPIGFEKVYRNEGIWPERRGLDTLIHYRTVLNPKPFINTGGLLAEQNKEWAKFRSLVNPVLMQPRTVRMYVPRMNKVADEFIKKIREIRDSKTNEVPGTFENTINLWTLEAVSVVALDTHLGLLKSTNENSDAKKLINALEKFFSLTVDLDINPSIWRWIRTPKYYKLMKAFDDLTEVSGKYINEALERYKNTLDEEKCENDKSVLERLLKHDKNVAIVMATDMLMAGVDTTTSAFTGCLLGLAKNPEKQLKLREEILKILPDKNSPLTSENMKNLPYLRACIKEALRLYPVVQGNLRKTACNIVLEGYRIPKGTDVFMISNELDNTEFSFEKANEFIPERWLRLQKDQNVCPTAGKSSHPFAYLPFGFGPRSCIGKRIVEMELETAISKIIRNFHVEFNYSCDDLFELKLIFVPNKELKFKFIEVDN